MYIRGLTDVPDVDTRNRAVASDLPALQPMTAAPKHRFADAIGRRAGADAGGGAVADAALEMWRGVADALTPVVGGRGVMALLHRSVFVAGREYPYLTQTLEPGSRDVNVDGLRLALEAQATAEAINGSAALFAAFDALVASMIGLALTERLLAPVWDLPSSGEAAQDVRT